MYFTLESTGRKLAKAAAVWGLLMAEMTLGLCRGDPGHSAALHHPLPSEAPGVTVTQKVSAVSNQQD